MPVAFTGITMVTITFGPSLSSATIKEVVALVSVGLLVFGVSASAWFSWRIWRLRRLGHGIRGRPNDSAS